MADSQWSQLPANRGWAESVASGGCHARSGARDRTIVRSATGGQRKNSRTT